MKTLISIFCLCLWLVACTPPKKEESPATPVEPKPVEFSDSKYSDMAKQSLNSLAQGNLDVFQGGIADDAVFLWNNGDSLQSKKAIVDYWTDRRKNVIDTISYTKDAWLGIEANVPPSHLAKGTWVFGWALMDITYTNKKSVKMWIHHVYHFNDQDKIDRFIQFLDRAPIAAALANK